MEGRGHHYYPQVPLGIELHEASPDGIKWLLGDTSQLFTQQYQLAADYTWQAVASVTHPKVNPAAAAAPAAPAELPQLNSEPAAEQPVAGVAPAASEAGSGPQAAPAAAEPAAEPAAECVLTAATAAPVAAATAEPSPSEISPAVLPQLAEGSEEPGAAKPEPTVCALPPELQRVQLLITTSGCFVLKVITGSSIRHLPLSLTVAQYKQILQQPLSHASSHNCVDDGNSRLWNLNSNSTLGSTLESSIASGNSSSSLQHSSSGSSSSIGSSLSGLSLSVASSSSFCVSDASSQLGSESSFGSSSNSSQHSHRLSCCSSRSSSVAQACSFTAGMAKSALEAGTSAAAAPAITAAEQPAIAAAAAERWGSCDCPVLLARQAPNQQQQQEEDSQGSAAVLDGGSKEEIRTQELAEMTQQTHDCQCGRIDPETGTKRPKRDRATIKADLDEALWLWRERGWAL